MDFLNHRDIHERLTTQAGSGFDPFHSLALAKLFRMKTLPWMCPHTVQRAVGALHAGANFSLVQSFKHFVPDIIYNANKIKNRSQAVDILDEVDRSLKQICPMVLSTTTQIVMPHNYLAKAFSRRSELSPGQGRQLWIEAGENENFVLHCAVCYGIEWYISEKLKDLPYRWQSSFGELLWRNELLSVACQNVSLGESGTENHPASWKFSREPVDVRNFSKSDEDIVSNRFFVHLGIVELLLRNGANPNAPLADGFSSWYLVLHSIRRKVDELMGRTGALAVAANGPSWTTRQRWGSLIRLFLDYGADPTELSHLSERRDYEWPCRALQTLISEACLEDDQTALHKKVNETYRRWRQGLEKVQSKRTTISRILQRLRSK